MDLSGIEEAVELLEGNVVKIKEAIEEIKIAQKKAAAVGGLRSLKSY